jgi:hypothetical protein
MTTLLSALIASAVLALSDVATTFAGASPTLLLLVAVSGAAMLAVALAVASVVLGLVLPARRAGAHRGVVAVPARQSDPRAAGHPQPRAPGAAA